MRPIKNSHCNVGAKQRGAVWVEFLIAASTLLVSLFILIPTLAKYMDIRHKTEQSAQYASWERTVWYRDILNEGVQEKPEDELLDEAKHRVLADGSTLVFSGQGVATAIEVDSFHYFTDSKNGVANYTSILSPRGSSPDQSLSISSNENNSQPSISKLDNLALIPSTVSLQTNINGVINKKGYYSNAINLQVKQPSWMLGFMQDNLTMSTSKALLVDSWGAGGNSYNAKQVNKLQPRVFVNTSKPALNAYKSAFSLVPRIANDLGELNFDHVDTEQLLESSQLGNYYQ